MFNAEILKIITEKDQNQDNIITYLLSLHYGLRPSYVPDIVKKRANILGIVNRDFKSGTVKWIVPLFDSENPQQIVPNLRWEWVHTEYRTLFTEIDPKRGGDKGGCIKKMKQFFAANPSVRKEMILEATKLYLETFNDGTQDPKYLIHADYFISKNKLSRLSQYIEILPEEGSNVPKRMKGLQDY